VLDQETKSPVPNAIVRVIVKNEDSFGEIESFVPPEPKTCTTDPAGECDLTVDFNTYGTQSARNSEAYINFRHRNLLVEARGYRPLNVPLKTLIGPRLELPVKQEEYVSDITVVLNKASGTTGAGNGR
jgi:hypothetical protein